MLCSFNKTIMIVQSRFERKKDILKECVETELAVVLESQKEHLWAGGKPGAPQKAVLLLLMCLLSK